MENKTSKVTAASFKKEWTGKYPGTNYDHNIEFANGDKGVYTSKKNPQDTFKIGEEVPYTIEKVERGGYTNFVIKPISEKGNGFGGNRSFAPKNYKADFISFAASYSKDLIVAGKADLKDLGKVFDAMYKKMADKLDEINGTSAPTNEQK